MKSKGMETILCQNLNRFEKFLCFAYFLDAQIFIDKKDIIYDPSGKLCRNTSNVIYKITVSRLSFAVTREFVIGGRNVRKYYGI